MGRSEELGTGIRNVYKYSKAYSGSDKIVFSEEDIFIPKVPLESLNLKNGELNGELNIGQTSVYQYIKKQEGMNARLLSQELKMPFRFRMPKETSMNTTNNT